MADKKCVDWEKVVEVKVNGKKKRYWKCDKTKGGCGAWGLLPKNANDKTTEERTPSGEQKPKGQESAKSKADEKDNKGSAGSGTGSESPAGGEPRKSPWYDRPLIGD